MRATARELTGTGWDLARLAARGPDACQIPWGICPDHGNTMVSTAGRTACRKCQRAWDYDRDGMPCEESARWLLTDAAGATSRVCDGHALDARIRLTGARLTPLHGDARGGGTR